MHNTDFGNCVCSIVLQVHWWCLTKLTGKSGPHNSQLNNRSCHNCYTCRHGKCINCYKTDHSSFIQLWYHTTFYGVMKNVENIIINDSFYLASHDSSNHYLHKHFSPNVFEKISVIWLHNNCALVLDVFARSSDYLPYILQFTIFLILHMLHRNAFPKIDFNKTISFSTCNHFLPGQSVVCICRSCPPSLNRNADIHRATYSLRNKLKHVHRWVTEIVYFKWVIISFAFRHCLHCIIPSSNHYFQQLCPFTGMGSITKSDMTLHFTTIASVVLDIVACSSHHLPHILHFQIFLLAILHIMHKKCRLVLTNLFYFFQHMSYFLFRPLDYQHLPRLIINPE